MTNTFWVSGNILFDLETGKTTQILLLANREEDATTFTEKDANGYFAFVKQRSKYIHWSLEPSKERAGQFVIKGVQNVEL
jgi:hypothetical protein